MLLFLEAVFKILPKSVATHDQLSLKIIKGSRLLGVIPRGELFHTMPSYSGPSLN